MMKKILLLFVLCTISLGAFSNATVTQDNWRWRNDDGNESTATYAGSTNQTISKSICQPGDTIRLRIGFIVSPDPAQPSNPASKSVSFQLGYSTSPSGPWTTISTDTDNAFVMTSSAHVTDGEMTTQQISTGDYGPGQIIDQNHTSNIFFSTPAGVTTNTEYEWVITPTSNVDTTTYYFMLNGLDGYNSFPSLMYQDYTNTGSQDVSACDSLVSPSGNYIWKTTGTYMDTIVNSMGCDSVITTNLTILNKSFSTITPTACDSYTSPSGNIYTVSGNYTDTIQNAAGCDSIITIDLTINYSSSGSDVITACDSYQWIDGNTYTSSNNTATHTLTNAAGCDSVVTLDLTINYSNTGTDKITACDSYQWIDGNTYTSSNNTATHTLTNAAGCDSVVTLDLTINYSNTGTDKIMACEFYQWIDGNTYTSSNNTATHTLANAAGCDSVVTLNLTVINVESSTMTMGETIMANNPNGTYQWIDCNNGNAPIAGENGQYFSPTNNGSYAVIVTESNCSDTSSCVLITTLGISKKANSNIIAIYPNPNSGLFTIALSSETTVEIRNYVGQIVYHNTLSAGNHAVALEALSNGMYIISAVNTEGNTTVQRIAINK